MTTLLPGLLSESDITILIIPDRRMPFGAVQPVPKSMTTVFGKPENGVTVTVAQRKEMSVGEERRFPVISFSSATCIMTSFASSVKLSAIAWFVESSKVDSISFS